MAYDLIVVGCSLGGLNAMQIVLAGLGRDFSTPIILVQHRDKNPGILLSRILQRYTHLQIVDADDKDGIEQGKLYLAPAGYHLLVDEDTISLSTELPIKHAQPSIDAAFESAARCYNERLIGVALTSSSADGAQGATAIETRGGLVMVQDPQTAENATLAKAVLNSTSHAQVVPLIEIGTRLTALCNARGGTNAVRASR